MRIEQIEDNMSILYTNHGHKVLYSFNVPVAGYSPYIGLYRTTAALSEEAIKHIEEFLNKAVRVVELTPIQIEEMFL